MGKEELGIQLHREVNKGLLKSLLAVIDNFVRINGKAPITVTELLRFSTAQAKNPTERKH